jgi:hypothetical protein
LLADERLRIERSSQTAAMSNYKAFINVADTLATVHDELSTVSSSLEALLEVRHARHCGRVLHQLLPLMLMLLLLPLLLVMRASAPL